MGAGGTPPLRGIRVLDLTTFLSGPFATQILADLGAEVIKVESPSGDSSRWIPPYFVEDDSAYFLAHNRNKRSIVIDLKRSEGAALLRNLILASDVVVENFRPGVCERLGFGADDMRKQKPVLIWASISGFGQTGPWSDRPAYDMIVQALSGVMSLTGEPGGPAVRLGVPLGDLAAGMVSVIGVLAALADRTRSGTGRVVDVSMLDSLLTMLSYQSAYAMFSGRDPQPQGRAHDSIPTYRSFTAGDGREFVVTANTERMWQSLCKVVGRPELTGDPRFVDAKARLANRQALWQILEEEIRRQPADVWVDQLVGAEVPAALIKGVLEALDDAEGAGRAMVLELADPGGQRNVRVVGNPVQYAGQPQASATYPPRLGEHTADVLTQVLGLDSSEVERLVSLGVVAGARSSSPGVSVDGRR